jgi:hypothetical protein
MASYKFNPANTDNFKYNQMCLAFTDVYFQNKKVQFPPGARLEYTNVNGDFISSNTVVKDDYFTFLPNLQFSNKISGVATMVLSYNKDYRVFYLDLNPFVFNNDSLNISFGNPNLARKPFTVFLHSYGMARGYFRGHQYRRSYSGNKILEYAFFDPQTGITKTTSLNIGKEFQSSVNLNLSMKIMPKWSLFVNGSIRYNTVTTKLTQL